MQKQIRLHIENQHITRRSAQVFTGVPPAAPAAPVAPAADAVVNADAAVNAVVDGEDTNDVWAWLVSAGATAPIGLTGDYVRRTDRSTHANPC